MSRSNSLMNKRARRAVKANRRGFGRNFLGVLPDKGIKNKYGAAAQFEDVPAGGGFGSCKVVN